MSFNINFKVNFGGNPVEYNDSFESVHTPTQVGEAPQANLIQEELYADAQISESQDGMVYYNDFEEKEYFFMFAVLENLRSQQQGESIDQLAVKLYPEIEQQINDWEKNELRPRIPLSNKEKAEIAAYLWESFINSSTTGENIHKIHDITVYHG